VERDFGEEYKFQDHYTSRYSRLLAEEVPELAEFFELRRLRAQ
jgi:hypothetical protein